MNYKGQLEGFPQEVVEKMLDYQEEQGNKRDVSVFEENKSTNKLGGGFSWDSTQEGRWFWDSIIGYKYFDKLSEWHFDTRNLIESGDAISTEDFNPYK